MLRAMVAVLLLVGPTAAAADKPMHFTIGNDVAMHVMSATDAQQQIDAIAAGAKVARVTAFEPYVKWSMMERSPGKWDFSFYDMQMGAMENREIKWVPFLIAGPAYATPR